MYLTHLLALNSGLISDAEFKPEFNADGLPKPLVLVGRNGSGKTNILSIIADGLVEIASNHFTDIMPSQPGGGRHYYRVLGGATVRNGANYELTALRFEHREFILAYRSKSGVLAAASVAERVVPFSGLATWPEAGNHKACNLEQAQIQGIYRGGCYVFFPSSRAEKPFWAGALAENNEESVFVDRYSVRLNKPPIVTTSIADIKPWIVDLILDQAIDGIEFAQNPAVANQRVAQAIQNSSALQNLNVVIRNIINNQAARLVRVGRAQGNRKIQVFSGDDVLLPSLDSLSAGQATLLSIFGTILRYADSGQVVSAAADMEGIVVVDEIDAHLHADLQYDALPKLMKQFPKIQFIVTSHSPLFPLGMQATFGEDEFTMLELPSATKIAAERFTEFTESFTYFQSTKKFEAALSERVGHAARPLIICEGETDPIYLKTAADLLGYQGLVTRVEFDWVGQSTPNGARDGGKDRLAQAAKLFKNNPGFVRSPTVLLFDFDSSQPEEDTGNLHIRTISENQDNNICRSGIENLLPINVFAEAFYDTVEKRTADITVIKKLKKRNLCDQLCNNRRNVADFEGFRPVLNMLAAALNIEAESQPAHAEI